MNKDEIDIMWQKAMQESIKDGEMFTRYHFAKLVAERALAEHAMRKVQRLGQEIEQEKALQALHDENERLGLYRDAYGQPEQEPVATLEDLEQEIYQNTRNFISRDVMEWMLRRYYTTPPQRKPLTDEQVISKALHLSGLGTSPDVLQFARAIEAAHGIKENT
jgi:hypothetical protein